MSSLGARLKQARERKRLTQAEVAAKIGISYGTLSGYERNYRDPDTDTLRKLANLYGVSTDWLLYGVETPAPDIIESRGKDVSEIIRLIEEEARRINLSPYDPAFKEMLADAFELIRIARGKDNN